MPPRCDNCQVDVSWAASFYRKCPHCQAPRPYVRKRDRYLLRFTVGLWVFALLLIVMAYSAPPVNDVSGPGETQEGAGAPTDAPLAPAQGGAVVFEAADALLVPRDVQDYAPWQSNGPRPYDVEAEGVWSANETSLTRFESNPSDPWFIHHSVIVFEDVESAAAYMQSEADRTDDQPYWEERNMRDRAIFWYEFKQLPFLLVQEENVVHLVHLQGADGVWWYPSIETVTAKGLEKSDALS